MNKLESKKINELFENCFFEEDEIINGRPTSEFTSVKSINKEKNITVSFSTNKLNQYKNKIKEYVDCLPKIEEGSILDELYYDKDGNKWCDGIKTIDQLMMLALACGLVSYTTIEEGEEELIIVKRTRENDMLEVKGVSPEVIPEAVDNQLSKGYTEEEKKLIAENKIRITRELNKYIEVINVGLGFFGICAEINKKAVNQMDFYDVDNNLLLNKNFEDTDGIIGLLGAFNIRLASEFNDTFGNKITYSVDSNSDRDRHIFLLNNSSYGYRIEITTKENSKNRYSNILIRTTDLDADYLIKNIEISDTDLKVELNNQFGPHGNYDDGEKRYLWYRNAKVSGEKLLTMIETEWPHKGHYLYGDSSEIKVDKNTLVSGLTDEQFNILSTNIALHPRNKELILYTIEEVNKQLPGVKEFINSNFSLYNFIINSEYQSDPVTDTIVSATVHEKCNLKGHNNVISKKR